MKTKVIVLVACASLAGLCSAQLSGISGIRVKAGYGWSGAITDTNGNRRHMSGPELGVDIPLAKLPLVDLSLTGDVLLGGQLSRGSDLDGNIYRFMLSGRFQVPTSKFSVFGGLGWGTAQGRGGQFASFNGALTQIGVAMPLSLGAGNSIVSPSLELAATFAGKSGLGGFSAGVSVRF